jgi:prephenate dehydrogenase
MDVTSVKQPAVEAMLESKAQVVGLHPMFRPEVSFDGQTVVVCPARFTDPGWKTWVVNMLTATRAEIKWSTPAEHDGT